VLFANDFGSRIPFEMSATCETRSTALSLRPASWAMGLAVLTVAAYANSFEGKFVFDDIPNIIESPRAQGLFTWDWRKELGSRFLWQLSLACDHHLWGGDPRNYHLLNVAFHVINVLLLFGLLRRTLRMPTTGHWSAEQANATAFAAAALWGVHPLGTQAVTYIVQRGEVLASTGILTFLYCFLRAFESESEANRPSVRFWLTAATLAFWGGMHCKEITAVAPIIAVLFAQVVLSQSCRELVKSRAVWALTLLPAYWWCIRVVFPPNSPVESAMGFSFRGTTPLQYLATQPGVVLHYLRLFVWPHPLCLDYRDWPIAASPEDWLGPALVVGASVLSMLCLLWKGHPAAVALAAFSLILSPTSSFVPIADVAFEHRMYLPAAALMSVLIPLAVVICDRAFRRVGLCRRTGEESLAPRLVSFGLLLTLIGGAAWRTHARNQDYSDPIRIWSETVRVRPANWRAQATLAAEYAVRSRIDEALAGFRLAEDLKPGYVIALFGQARCLWALGHVDEAERKYRQVIATAPMPKPPVQFQTGLPLSYSDLGALLFLHRHRPEEAEPLLRTAIHLGVHDPDPYVHLGTILGQWGRDVEALLLLEQGLSKRRTWWQARRELAWLLATTPISEIRNIPRAAELIGGSRVPSSKRSPRDLEVDAAVRAAEGRFDEALALLDEALEKADGATDSALRDSLAARRSLFEDRQAFVRHPAEKPSSPSSKKETSS
jgi:tetratricopeptide (TPR) repeat protein